MAWFHFFDAMECGEWGAVRFPAGYDETDVLPQARQASCWMFLCFICLYVCEFTSCAGTDLCFASSEQLENPSRISQACNVALCRKPGQKMVHGRMSPAAAQQLPAELCRSARRRRRRQWRLQLRALQQRRCRCAVHQLVSCACAGQLAIGCLFRLSQTRRSHQPAFSRRGALAEDMCR